MRAQRSKNLRSPWLLLVVAMLLPSMQPAIVASATGTPIKINFQRSDVTTPAGYLRDSGEAFGPRLAPDQGSGAYTYGWVNASSGTGEDMSRQGRDRGRSAPPANLDQRLDTLVHMQPASGPAARWEIELANGSYDVTVAVGDADDGSASDRHTVQAEGITLTNRFEPQGNPGTYTRHRVASMRISVGDNRLTLDAGDGVNTKINYLDIVAVSDGDPVRPTVREVTPANATTNVPRNAGILATVVVPNGGIEYNTVNEATVRLMRLDTGAPVPFNANTSGGGDVIAIQPSVLLEPNTTYLFEVTDGVRDAARLGFVPFYGLFTTGTAGGSSDNSSGIAFEREPGVAKPSGGSSFSSVTIGPDQRLYAATLQGEIYRFTIAADGKLSNRKIITTVREREGGSRAIIGLAWDPQATASNLVLWVSHNGPYVVDNAPDWTGKLARLSGANLENFQNYVVGLPHSFKDHMNNSLVFGPDEKLYLSLGSNSAMGEPDPAWGLRPERLLNGSVVQIDTQALMQRGNSPLNVQTEDGGDYDPFAPGAAVTLYATGVRNAYDLVWHSNGQLYVPTNGSAAGGRTPAIPNTLPGSCAKRIDGKAYSGPRNKPEYGLLGADTQKDWLFRVVKGGYYGHPNPLRCEWIANGGNPTRGNDAGQVGNYPSGTLPDPNWRGAAYDFGLNKSPNGAIEYQSNVFSGTLKGYLLVVRFSLQDDIIALKPGGPNQDIVAVKEGLPGLSGLDNPLDLIENTLTGDLYVVEFGHSSQISLLRPRIGSEPAIELTPDRIVTSDSIGGNAGGPQTLSIRNIGTGRLMINSVSLTGDDAGQFRIVGTPPSSLAPGVSVNIQVEMIAASKGVKTAKLRVSSNDKRTPIAESELRGLGTAGTGGNLEPSLQWILDAYDIKVNVGDPNPSDNALPASPLLGDEVALDRFVRADNANPVVVEPLAVFGPNGPRGSVLSLGWYETGNPGRKNELFGVPNGSGQRLNPTITISRPVTFDPGTIQFGFYSTWPAFEQEYPGGRFSEDALNSWEPNAANRHKVRVYPLKDRAGLVVPDAYVVATEEYVSSYDYQDVVVVVRNVRAAEPANSPPQANAGADQRANLGARVTLSGSGTDPNPADIASLSFGWTQTGGSPVALTNADKLVAEFVASQPGSYRFSLTVRDPGGLTAEDSVEVVVARQNFAGSGGNMLVDLDDNVTLQGSTSSTSGGSISYQWEQIGGPVVTLSNPTAAQPSFSAPATPTTLRFRLRITGSDGSTTEDTVTVVVADLPVDGLVVRSDGLVSLGSEASFRVDGAGRGAPSWAFGDGETASGAAVRHLYRAEGSYSVTLTLAAGTITLGVQVTNSPPVARAGSDQAVRVGSSVTLSGSGEDSDSQEPVRYRWEQVSGTAVTMSNSEAAQATFTAPGVASVLIFRLTVTDAYGKQATDDVVVAVADGESPPPLRRLVYLPLFGRGLASN